MGGGTTWFNPASWFSDSSDRDTVSSLPHAGGATTVAGKEEPKKKADKKKKRPATILTSTEGDTSKANTLHQTLGGA